MASVEAVSSVEAAGIVPELMIGREARRRKYGVASGPCSKGVVWCVRSLAGVEAEYVCTLTPRLHWRVRGFDRGDGLR